MKTLEDGWYVIINAYKFAIFEIWGHFFVLSMFALSLHTESTNSMIAIVAFCEFTQPVR